MLNLMTIELEAINARTNLFRQYVVQVGKDLFGEWLLTTAYGRHGKGAKVKTYAFTDLAALEKRLKLILKKRVRSEKRIGVNYKVINYDFPKEMVLFADIAFLLQ